MSVFRKAERKKSKARIGIAGVSGSGKTWSSLRMARGIVGAEGRIAFLDSENHSAELYAKSWNEERQEWNDDGVTHFDVLDIEPPFTPQKYIDGIKAAENEGYDIIIIDSLSHAWSGEGGILDLTDKYAQSNCKGNKWAAWRKTTPMHNKLVDAMMQSKCHVITCMRSKQDYVQQEGDRGGKKIVKMGLAPIQRDGMEYEFTMMIEISIDGHIATADKNRLPVLKTPEVITEDTGAKLAEWLNSGADAPAEQPQTPPQRTQAPQQGQAVASGSREAVDAWIAKIKELDFEKIDACKDYLSKQNFTKEELKELMAACDARGKAGLHEQTASKPEQTPMEKSGVDVLVNSIAGADVTAVHQTLQQLADDTLEFSQDGLDAVKAACDKRLKELEG